MKRRALRDGAVTLAIMFAVFIVSLVLSYLLSSGDAVSALFVFAVFLVSFLTDGYLWGFISAAASMLIVNFAFTYPFFHFNFTLPENIVSALIFTTVALLTSTLTTQIKRTESIKREGEREKMRANLLRAVSHDLRTPLTTIYGSATTLLDNYQALSDEQICSMLRGVTEDSESLLRMVENLLSVTRLDGGSVKINKMPTAVFDLFDSVIAKLNRRYPDAKISVNIPDGLLLVPMDALLIEQVLINLLENAVQHAKGFTKIELSANPEGEYAKFSVRDDGAGISPELIPELFTGRLGKGDSEGRGMGIGLSVCESIVKAHGGRITVTQLSPHGTEFSFSLEGASYELQ
ncbi:MAG: PAS domain-containing sensor histidine kinase [Clostridia bacterium]|nr:PAS domain-containing sensor histidine kinase [Clostridia bacterium]MBP3583357.1 PAS domain-containing sensor histidine kinase [Clostridia bacterium]